MADPRAAVNNISKYRAQTYAHDATIVYDAAEEGGSAQVGLAVTQEGSQTVSLVGDGEQVEGKLIKVESDGLCVVQIEGDMELPGGDSATLTEGASIVGDLGAAAAEGYIRAVATGTAAELGVARGTIVDSSTATAVVVRLP